MRACAETGFISIHTARGCQAITFSPMAVLARLVASGLAGQLLATTDTKQARCQLKDVSWLATRILSPAFLEDVDGSHQYPAAQWEAMHLL